MRQIIIGTQQQFGNDLTAGEAVVDMGTDLATGALTLVRTGDQRTVRYEAANNRIIQGDLAFAPGEEVYFMQGIGGGAAIRSVTIDPSTLRWNRSAYAAPVAKVLHIGRPIANETTYFPAGFDPTDHVGKYAVLRIIDLSKPVENQTRYKNVEYLIKLGDSILDIHNGLTQKLQQYNGEYFATAVSSTAGNPVDEFGFIVTGIPGQNFRILLDGVIKDGAVDVNTENRVGVGVAAHLAEIERNYATQSGYNANSWLQGDLYNKGFSINPATNYDVYTLKWTNHGGMDKLGIRDHRTETTMLIAVPTGAVFVAGTRPAAGNVSGQLHAVLTALANPATTWGA
jgi:hypothetical protein